MTALRRALRTLPSGPRTAVRHRLGRYAPWEPGFDFTPPERQPGEETGPPDFVGIGAQKAGTTWWYELLSTHPGVFGRPDIHKERHFFDRFASEPFSPADIEAYHGWFPRPPGSITGEWTPDYCTFPWAPELVRRAAPDTRVLVLLRDPVERFRSGLAHQRRAGRPLDGLTLADAVQRGFYHQALVPWWEQFDPARVLVLQYERCVADLRDQLAATFSFLGLTEYHVSDVELPPQTDGVPGGTTPMPDDARRRLVELYAPDVELLAARLPQIDLGLWPNFAHLAGGGTPGSDPLTGSSPTRRR